MPERPRIYVVLRHYMRKGRWQGIVQEAHLEQLINHGAAPIVIPRLPETVDFLDAYGPMHGLLIVEGRDVQPKQYGGAPDTPADLIESPDKGRDKVEMALLDKLFKEGQPYLGVCRGSHLYNVVKGGTLYGDVMHVLKSDLKHVDYDNYDDYRHHVKVVPGSPLQKWLGKDEFMANSFHHQGVRKMGENLEPMCHSDDGLVEGFYDTTHPFRIGLQFHPERLAKEEPGCGQIFEDFVAEARKFMQTGKP